MTPRTPEKRICVCPADAQREICDPTASAKTRDFANTAPAPTLIDSAPAEIGARAECFANAVQAKVGEDGFVRIAEYGAHPYGPDHVQDFTRASAESIVRRFRAAANSIVRAVFRTNPFKPVFHGHPDHPDFSAAGHDDWELLARITDMQARDDGLYVRPDFTDAGNAALASGQKLWWSPRWLTELTAIRGKTHHWTPFKLVSAGLTPTPNIYGSAANSRPATQPDNPTPPNPHHTMPSWIKNLIARLGYTADQANAAAENKDGAPPADEIASRVNARLDAANAHDALAAAIRPVLQLADDAPLDPADIARRLEAADQANADLQGVRSDLEEARADLANERKERATLIVAQALGEGRLAPTERDAKIDALAKAKDFSDAANAILTAPRLLPSGGKAEDLGDRKGEMQDQANARDAFNAGLADFANEQKLDLDKDYHTAYARFKKSEKGKALLEAMSKAADE